MADTGVSSPWTSDGGSLEESSPTSKEFRFQIVSIFTFVSHECLKLH